MKNLTLLTIISILLILLLPVWAGAADYTAYFADDGTDDIVGTWDASECTEGDPCNTLAEAQAVIDDVSSADTVTLYFAQGDTWTMNTDAVSTTVTYGLLVSSDDPIVNIDAYGAGAKPIFDGTVVDYGEVGTDFNEVNSHNATTGPKKWNHIIWLQRNSCSVKNIHFNGFYGIGVKLGNYSNSTRADYTTIDSCDFTIFGNKAISADSGISSAYTNITNNLIHTGAQLQRFDKWPAGSYPGAVMLHPIGVAGSDPPTGSVISYNVVYDIAGEGIHACGCTVEYNVVGDTGSVGIYVAPWNQNATDSIVRYNLVVMSALASSVYDNDPEIAQHGIGIADEGTTGDNSGATVEIYGNTIINRRNGIIIAQYGGQTATWAGIKIYNNTIIDCNLNNLVIATAAYDKLAAGSGFIYNNASILYDQTTKNHFADDSDPANLSTYWTIDNNAFWTTGGSPTVDADWQTDMITGDPKLLGEVVPVDWDGQSGVSYYEDIIFNTHLYLAEDSALINAGIDLNTDVDASYDDDFLTYGTDYRGLPENATFTLADQDVYTPWDIGAVVYVEYPHNLPPVISAVSVTPTTVANEGTLTYSVTASDPEAQTITYSWRINGTEFGTTSGSTYVLPASYDDSTVEIYCQVCDPTDNCVNSSTFNIDVGTVASTTDSLGENTANTYTGVTVDGHINYTAGAESFTLTEARLSDDNNNYDKKVLISFDTSDISGKTITDAYLKIYIFTPWTGTSSISPAIYDNSNAFDANATWLTYDGANAWTGTHGQNTELDTITIASSDGVDTAFNFEGATFDTYIAAQVLAGNPVRLIIAQPTTPSGYWGIHSSESTNGLRPALYVSYADTVTATNDFANDADVDNWWEMADGTDSKGSDDLSSFGDPSFASSTVTLDGDDALYLANLTVDRDGDFSVFIENFHFDAEIADNTSAILASEWDGPADEKCWALGIKDDSGGGADDEILFTIGTNAGADSNDILDTSFNLVHTTSYDVIATYDNTNDDVHIYTWNTAGTAQQNTDPNGTVAADINAESVQFNIGRLATANAYLTGDIGGVTLFKKELTADEAQACASDQYPVASIIDISAQTPDTTGTVGIGDTLVVSIEFDKSVTWTDAALPYGYIEVEAGGTDLALYHSSPATTVAGTIHYFSTHATDANYVNSMIVAGMTSADANLTAGSITLNGGTFQYGSPAIDVNVALPADSLSGNAAIIIDTSTPTISAFFHCNSAKVQIAAETTYNTGDTCYLCVESDGDTVFFNDGPLGNLQIGTDMSYPANEEFEYYTGIGTAILQFYRTITAGDRDLDLQAEGTADGTGFIHGATTLQDEGGNEITYTLPQADPDGGNIIISAPGVFTLGTGGNFPLWSDGSTGFHDVCYDLDNDTFWIMPGGFTDDVVISTDNVVMRGYGRKSLITGTGEITGADGYIGCVLFSTGFTDTGGSSTYHPICGKDLQMKIFRFFY